MATEDKMGERVFQKGDAVRSPSGVEGEVTAVFFEGRVTVRWTAKLSDGNERSWSTICTAGQITLKLDKKNPNAAFKIHSQKGRRGING